LNNSFDVIVIGAGAAGLMCAIESAKRNKKVLVLDHAKKIGEKIRISGGGRCNFTNLNTHPSKFISENPKFVISALNQYDQYDFIKLVEDKIIDISAVVRGCALCEASAGLVVELFKNKNVPDEKFLNEFLGWLENTEKRFSDQLPIEMEIFEPIREIKNRHKCITMPFEATCRSVDFRDN